jgi:transposase
MGKHSEVFVTFDVAKKKHAVAIAEGGRREEVRFLGDVENSPSPIERTIRRLADRYDRLQVCFEAGPMGYGLYRQVEALGHDCMVVPPALIPKRSGERLKTNRRDAVTLARLQRPRELTPNRPFAGSETDWRRRRYSNGPRQAINVQQRRRGCSSPTHWRVGRSSYPCEQDPTADSEVIPVTPRNNGLGANRVG